MILKIQNNIDLDIMKYSGPTIDIICNTLFKIGGVVTLLYGVLLYDGPPRQSTPPPLTPMVQQVVTAALSMLLSVARFNLYTLQVYDTYITGTIEVLCFWSSWGVQ